MTTGQPDRVWVNERNASGEVKIAGNIIPLQGKTFPNDASLEKLVIGHLIALGDMGEAKVVLKRMALYLHHDDFYYTRYGTIYEAMIRIVQRGDDVDAVSVITELKSRRGHSMTALQYVGGEKAIYALTNVIPQNTETHARAIARLSLKRSGKLFAQLMDRLCDREDSTIPYLSQQFHSLYQDFNARVSSLSHVTAHYPDETVVDDFQNLYEEIKNPNHETGIDIWIEALNELLLGWRKQKLYILAAGTSMGKSAFLLSAALEALKAGQSVLFISLEMPYQELLERLISMLSEVDYQSLQRRDLNAVQLTRLHQAEEKLVAYLNKARLVIERLNSPTMYEIEGKIDYHSNEGLDIVFIDYIGVEMIQYSNGPQNRMIQRVPGPTEHGNHLWAEMRRIKSEKPYPFVVGAQVNRAYMNRAKGNKRPNKTDISNSSKAENAADALLLLHREEVDDVGIPGHADITVAKNRSGPGGSRAQLDLLFNKSTTKFENWRGNPVVTARKTEDES